MKEKIPIRKLTTAEHELVLKHGGLIGLSKQKYPALVRLLGEEEADSTAWLAMCMAAIRFDPAKGQWSTWAVSYIWGYWMSQVTRRERHVQPLEIDVPASPAPETVNDDEARLLEAAVRRLNPIHQRAVRRCVMDGLTLETAAREFGVTKEAVRQARDRGLAVLRKILRHSKEA